MSPNSRSGAERWGGFLPTPSPSLAAQRLSALRDDAVRDGHELLAHLIEVALVEAERIAERAKESRERQD